MLNSSLETMMEPLTPSLFADQHPPTAAACPAQNWFLGYEAFKSLVGGLDRSLAWRTWLVGERLTLADVFVAYAMRYYYLLVCHLCLFFVAIHRHRRQRSVNNTSRAQTDVGL